MALLMRRFNRINVLDALEIIPRDQVVLSDLWPYLKLVLSTTKLTEVDNLVLEKLFTAQCAFKERELSAYSRAQTVLPVGAACPVCQALLKSEGGLMIYKNGRIVC